MNIIKLHNDLISRKLKDNKGYWWFRTNSDNYLVATEHYIAVVPVDKFILATNNIDHNKTLNDIIYNNDIVDSDLQVVKTLEELKLHKLDATDSKGRLIYIKDSIIKKLGIKLSDYHISLTKGSMLILSNEDGVIEYCICPTVRKASEINEE